MKYTCVSKVTDFQFPRTMEGFSFLAVMGYDTRCFQIECEPPSSEDALLFSASGIHFPYKMQSKSMSSVWEIRGFNEAFDFKLVLDTFYVNLVRAEGDSSSLRDNLYEALFQGSYKLEIAKKEAISDEEIEASVATSIKYLLGKII